MKNNFLLLAYFFVLSLFYSCEKTDEPFLSEKLNFVDLREVVYQTPFTVIDDSIYMTTAVKFKDSIIFNAEWRHGIYSGPIMKTRLLWARSESNLNFIIIGFNDLFYLQLIVIRANDIVSSHNISIIDLLESGLRKNETIIWFKYNNSWSNTGKVPDSEVQIFL